MNATVMSQKSKQPEQARPVDWTQSILQVIDTRSFSNIWYWVIVAITWSTVSTWVMGVPTDMIHRARREGGQVATDLSDLVRVLVNRQLTITGKGGVWLIGILCFLLTTLAVLGIFYGVEMALAIFLLAFPLSFVGALTASNASLIAATDPQGDALYTILLRQRLWTQIIAMIAIFVTAMVGMYQNFAVVRWL